MAIFDPAAELFNSKSGKKKKRFLLFLSLNKNADSNNIQFIEKIIATTLPNFIAIRLEDPDEALKALIIKNIELIILDFSFFMDDSITVDYALELKSRRKCPIFFITHNANKLVNEYRTKMYAYEELDDYFTVPIDPVEISKSLKRVTTNPGRAAKRFSINIPVSFLEVTAEKRHSVTLNEISLVGFAVTLHEDVTFERKTQIRITLPLREFNLFHPQYGEFIHLSAKIQRISINGKTLGCSFEHMTPLQMEILINLLAEVSRAINIQRVNAAKKAMNIEE